MIEQQIIHWQDLKALQEANDSDFKENMDKFISEFVGERNDKVILLGFYNSTTKRGINVMNYISNSKQKHERFTKEDDLIEQEDFEFYGDTYDSTNHESSDGDEDEKEKTDDEREEKFDDDESEEKTDFDDDVMMLD